MTSATPALSVVIPVYDEEGSLPGLQQALLAAAHAFGGPFEILYVDDGSRDQSPAILDGLAATVPEVRVIRLDRNHGLSSALHAGFNRARGDLIGTLDADLQNDPMDLLKLREAIEQGADMACGWRRDRDDPAIKKLSSKVANGFRNWRTQSDIQDVTCPLKLFRREVRVCFHPFDGMHRFLPMLARMQGFNVVEVPVSHHKREHGQSKYGVWNRVFKGLSDLKVIRWMQRTQMNYVATEISRDGDA